MDNLILIGMPGSGKSTIGVVLAKLLGYEFMDSDLVIQKEEGRRLFEIMREEGIEGFLEIENRINSQLSPEKTVIATGGSAVYGTEAMEHLKKIGKIMYLKLSYEAVAERLGDLEHRGVVLKEGYTLKDLYEERVPLYEKYAQIVVDEENLTLEETLEMAFEKLKKEGFAEALQ